MISRFDLGGVGECADGWANVNLLRGSQVRADILDLDSFALDGGVDEFLASHTVEHIPLYLLHDWLADVLRKLRPGGHLTVIQTDARRVLQMYCDGELSFTALRDVLFVSRDRRAESVAATGRDLQAHQYAWGACDLMDELLHVGFAPVQSFDAGTWSFDVASTMPHECNELYFGTPIPNLGLRAYRP